MDGVSRDMVGFYSERYIEGDRLNVTPHGRLERERTRELLDRHIDHGAPRVVVDVGGATGVHAAWLAERGHRVELFDLVPAHVEQAGRIPGVSARVADARDLPLAADTADAVLLLGPLYHLLEREDRLQALREARRVARDGAPVFAVAISRHLPAMVYGSGPLDEITGQLIRLAAETGYHDERLGFTSAHLHTPAELAGEVREAGFTSAEVLGVEGPMWPTLDAIGIDRIDETLPAAIACAQILERDHAIMSASAHLMAIAPR